MSNVGTVLLGWGVLWCSHAPHHCSCMWVVGIPQLDEAKVHQYHPPIRPDDHVLWLDVPVDHALFVAVRQGIEQLIGPQENLILRQRTVSHNEIGQALPLDKVHNQIDVAAFLKVVDDADEVRMAQMSQNPGFPPKLLVQLEHRISVEPRLKPHLFYGDGHFEAEVPGAIDGPHPPSAEEGGNTITILKNGAC